MVNLVTFDAERFKPHDVKRIKKKPKVTIYTDGGCNPNPGVGAYSAIILLENSDKAKVVVSKSYKRTTNSRMEILGIVHALSLLKYSCNVTIFCDNQYVVNAVDKGWAQKWKKNNWCLTSKGSKTAKHPDLFNVLLQYCDIHTVKANWVKGHQGNLYNELCDKFSSKSIKEKFEYDMVFITDVDELK